MSSLPESPISAMRPVFQGAQQNRINATEARIFWLALILCPLYWSISFITALFGLNFKWLLLVCIAIVLNGANLYGYVKCKMGNDKNISAATSDFFRKQVIQNVHFFLIAFHSIESNNLSHILLINVCTCLPAPNLFCCRWPR